MPKKSPPKKKPTRKLTQHERFIEAAKAAECDETGETFKKAIESIVKKT
jgi:hypothetical protein